MHFRLMLAALLAALLCASHSVLAEGAGAAPVSANVEGEGKAAPAGDDGASAARNAPRILRGNDVVVGAQRPVAPVAGPAASLKFEDAPIVEIVHTVMGEILKLDYAIHPPLAGNITLNTQAPIPADQMLSVLESVLQANGIVIARDTRGFYHVGKPEALKGIVSPPRLAGKGVLPAGSGTVVVPLQYIGAGEMAEVLRPVAAPEAFVRVDTVRNLLVLAGSRNQVEGWLEIVSIFDVDLLKGMSVGIFPLQHASIREVEAALRLMTSGGEAGAARGAAPGAAAGASAGAAAGAGGGASLGAGHPLHGAVRIMPIERLNSILVVTPRAAYLDQARSWIERLDRPADNGGEPQLYVYAVQNGSAKHLATVLNGIFGADPAAAKSPESGVAPGLRAVSGASGGLAGTGAGVSSGSGAMAGGLASAGGGLGAQGGLSGNIAAQAGAPLRGEAGVTQVALAPGVRVIADELNNAILIYGPRSEYSKIEATLRRLDVAPIQVLIEASIVEVTLNDELKYGLQWHFTDNARHGLTGSGRLNTNSSGPIGPLQPGFSYTLTNALGDIRAVLNALADKSLVKVISSPSLMVLDNHTAAIQVGDQQPIQVGQTITDGGNVSTAIQYKDTGVNLAVTPSVNAGNVVTMRINQSVTDVGPVDSATQQRTFLQRQIGSRVAVKSGESIVLGGLIRDNSTTGRAGVPFLHDIPILGNLFGATSVEQNRTELLVVITPRVVRTEQDARDVGAELRERMRGLKGFAAEVGAAGESTPKAGEPGSEKGGRAPAPDHVAEALAPGSAAE